MVVHRAKCHCAWCVLIRDLGITTPSIHVRDAKVKKILNLSEFINYSIVPIKWRNKEPTNGDYEYTCGEIIFLDVVATFLQEKKNI